jgi:hypothetical protein
VRGESRMTADGRPLTAAKFGDDIFFLRSAVCPQGALASAGHYVGSGRRSYMKA